MFCLLFYLEDLFILLSSTALKVLFWGMVYLGSFLSLILGVLLSLFALTRRMGDFLDYLPVDF